MTRFVILCASFLSFALADGAQARSSRHRLPTRADTTACCSVVRVDVARAIVTARETATGYTFRFTVRNRKLLASLKIGDRVWADFTKLKISLRPDEATPCCPIIRTPLAKGAAPTTTPPTHPEL
ncbi:MAG: hypothetical protein ABR543_03660 [Gemmatimonadaceae bacterium]